MPRVASTRILSENISQGIDLRHVLIMLVRKIKGLGGVIFQAVDYFLDAAYDCSRYHYYSRTDVFSKIEKQRLEALLFFYYHKIEKSLALPDVKPVFGLSYIELLINLADTWICKTEDLNSPVFKGTYTALLSYQKHVNTSLQQQKPDLSEKLAHFLSKYQETAFGIGSVINIGRIADEPIGRANNRTIADAIKSRHSVRIFSKEHIPDQFISEAVQLAQSTPSGCNRQCWRVHVYSSIDDKTKILKHQNGNAGFGDTADRILLITSDLRTFFSSKERRQPAIEGGMFAMTLLLALESFGIGSCCLNLAHSAREEQNFRRASGIPLWETPIMLIAVGYPPEFLRVAASARKTTESMLTFHEPRMG
jgi:nitroreductase